MPSRKRRTVNAALLGAAAAALTVKGTLAGPLGVAAQGQVDQLKHSANDRLQAALLTSRHAVVRAGAQLVPPSLPVSSQSTAAADSARPSPQTEARPRYAAVIAEEPPARPTTRAFIKRILTEAAQRHHLDPKLVMALSYWESGWDQRMVSQSGAVGLMQVEPATADEAGPGLLGRAVDISDPYDNADVGAAILREDLENFGDPAMALAAYYQGPTSLRENGMLPETQQYVEGILDLAARIN
jgi:soluble lytic murein transglycosylase-like protein